MIRHIDVKSALIGGLLVLVGLCLFGAVPSMSPEWFGRFKMTANDGHAFVLDSGTEQVWALCATEGYPTIGEEDPNTFFAPKLEVH